MANGFLSSLFGGRQAPASPTAAPTSPQQDYFENMQRIVKGDVSQALTGGERLMALGALLRSAARGSQTTPQQVMQQVRETAQGRTNMQMQMAQLQAKAMREQQQQAFIQRYAEALPEDKRDVLKNMDTAEAFKVVSGEAFRPKQVFQLVDGPAGTKVVQYGDGTRAETDIPNSVETTTVDVGDKKLLVNKRTGETIFDYKVGISPAEAARISQGERRLSRMGAGGGGGGGGTSRGQLVRTDQGFAVFNPQTGALTPMQTTLRPAAAANPFANVLTGGTGTPRFRQ